MLEQLVYTRGKPRINLNAGGAIIPTDGFGVCNVSEDLLSRLKNAKQRYYVLDRAAVKNGSNEVKPGLFNSYEYTRVNEDTFFLSFEFSRPYSSDLSIPGGSRLSGIFVKQCLIGRPEGYPCAWIGAELWNAWKLSDAEYRHDFAPTPLPALNEQTPEGTIRAKDVEAFLADGRLPPAVNALWFLLRQLSLPETEQQVLLIRDVPEHVEHWVAALQMALSPEMAREITFVTNRSNLSIRTERTLFYYCAEEGSDDTGYRKQKPYCLIVGFHPKDPGCTGLMSIQDGGFVLLNGTDRSTSFHPEITDREAAFLKAALHGDEAVREFFRRPFGSLPLKSCATLLPDLFEADLWLRHAASADYASLTKHLNCLSSIDWSEMPAFWTQIESEAINSLADCLKADACSGWRLTDLCWGLLRTDGKRQELTTLLLSYLTCDHFSAGGISRLAVLEQDAGACSGWRKAVRDELFSDWYLPGLSTVIQNGVLNAESVAELLRMHFDWLVEQGDPADRARSNLKEQDFLREALEALSAAPKVLDLALQQIGKYRLLPDALFLQITADLGEKGSEPQLEWLRRVFTLPDIDVARLFDLLRANALTAPENLEQLLVTVLNRQNFDLTTVKEAFRSLVDYGYEPDGLEFYRAVLGRTPQRLLPELIHDIRVDRLPIRTRRELFLDIDATICFPAPGQNVEDLLSAMNDWGCELSKELGAACISTVVYLCCFSDRFSKKQDPVSAEELVRATSAAAGCLYPEACGYYQSDAFLQVVRRAAAFRTPRLHAALLTMFDRSRIHPAQYYEAYVTLLLSVEENAKRDWRRLLTRKSDSGLDQAAILLETWQILKDSGEDRARQSCQLLVRSLQEVLLRRGEKRLLRDLRDYEKVDFKNALNLKRLLRL